jgi:ATP phosphoribosyltransferase
MSKTKIRIGLPSKGRLRDLSLAFLKSKNLEVKNSFGKRNYFFKIKNNNEIDGIFLHAREIIERINDGTLDIGISGLDILKELPETYSKNVKIFKKLNFGFANLVAAIPKDWIDVQNMADLEEVSFEFREKYGRRMRVATKYPNLTEYFFLSKGISQFRVVPSLGATESYPFTGSSELITDITSTGSTLKANNLRIVNDGIILKSSACIFKSKKIQSKIIKKKLDL